MIEYFLEFEEKNDLFNFEISEIYLWHRIRVMVFNEINQKVNEVASPHNADFKIYGISHLKKKIKQLKYLFKKNIFINVKQSDILIFNHSRRVMDSGKYHCLYTSELINELQYNYTVIEKPHNLSHYSPIPENKIKYSDSILLIYNIRKILNKTIKKSNITTNEKKKIVEIFTQINKEFSVNLNIDNWIKKIDELILFYQINYKSYKKIIRKVNPKVIIEVVSYGRNLYDVNKIAKEFNIPTIELQHGVMGDKHIAYNFLKERNIETFPDYVFSFGKYWNDNTRLPIHEKNIISVGWPYYEKKVRKNEFQKDKKRKNTILFISQGTIGEELSKFAFKLSELIDSNSYNIIYKLHPGEYSIWKEKYHWLLNTPIKVIDSNEKDMHYYFSESDIQLGVNSTALYEGLGYKLNTFIVKLPGYKSMEYLIDHNYAELIVSPDELLCYVNNNSIQKQSFNIEYFWEQDSMSKMLTELNKIIKNKSD